MPGNRFFADAPLEGTVLLVDREAHHLSRVMRNKVGDFVEVINGRGEFAEATVTSIEKEAVELHVNKKETKEHLTTPFRLIQGIPQMAKLELLLEKCVELGCSEFWFFTAAKSEPWPLSAQKKERLHYIVISALKQCGAYHLPRIIWIDKIEKAPPPPGPIFFGDLRPTAERKNRAPCSFINGPESGLTEKEIAFFEKQWRAEGISLHPHTLRTETAAIVATAYFT